MAFLDWTNLQFYHFIALGGGILALLAVVIFFVPGGRLKVPAVVVSTLCSLAAGVGIGMVAMAAYGYDLRPLQDPGSGAEEGAAGGPPGGRMGRGGPGMGGMMGGGGPPGGRMMGGGGPPGGATKPGMGGGRREPNPKAQLADLVAKLDLLTRKPLEIKLTDEQKQEIQKQLEGLSEAPELADEAAKRKLTALLQILEKDNKEVLEAVGLQRPGENAEGGAASADAPNPFRTERMGRHLKSLQQSIRKDAT